MTARRKKVGTFGLKELRFTLEYYDPKVLSVTLLLAFKEATPFIVCFDRSINLLKILGHDLSKVDDYLGEPLEQFCTRRSTELEVCGKSLLGGTRDTRKDFEKFSRKQQNKGLTHEQRIRSFREERDL